MPTSSYIDQLVQLPSDQRRQILASLSLKEREALNSVLSTRGENKWAQYADDPVGFVTEGLGETVWSRQREILESIRDNKRTAVPACHAPGKSHIAARAVAWWVSSHPPGTARVVTTASTFRQVRGVLWTAIRRLHTRYDLPGNVLQTEWHLAGDIAAQGFSPADHDEAAVQGIHAPHLLVVVDEAGGLGNTLGTALEALMTGGHTRLLLLGNPPTDQEGSWFEQRCNSDLYNVIPISVFDTPNFTGEETGWCKACPPETPRHKVAEHLVDKSWVEDVTKEFGEDSAFVEARVHARFPRQVANKVIPLSWAEQATENPLDLAGPVRLGVDVASDGGDEFVVAWATGGLVTIRHRSSGKANANAVDVAGIVLEQIREAEKYHRENQILEPVRVKVDSIGLGWGVTSALQRWKDEQRHSAIVIGVNVADRARDHNRFTNQRAEMWWNARTLLQPRDDGSQDVRLEVDDRTVAQMSAPQYASDSSGRIKIESKVDMKRRGMHSPDRAEAILLALYEPGGHHEMVAPLSFTQSNDWQLPSL